MNFKRFFIIFVLLFGIACNLVSRIPASQIAESTSTSILPTFTSTAVPPTPIPVYVPPACAGKPMATLPAATTVAEPTLGLGTNPPLSQSDQMRIFDELTSPIPSLYVYPDLNGLDWPATISKYQTKIESGLNTETFYIEMQNLITELGDEHSQYLSPVEVTASSEQLGGKNDYVGIGVVILPMLEKSRLSIILVFPGSTADHAGLKPHDSLLAVDGIPLVENGISYPQRVRGPVCSAAVFTVQSPGESPRSVIMVRSAITSSLPIIARLIPTQDGSRIGYIFLPSFYDETFPGQVKQALEQFGQLDGLILDNRMNSGGSSDVVEPILGYFTDGIVGNFASRTETRPLQAIADPINNSQTVPMVILVGTDTVSFGEIFSGVLQDIGRAKIVGQTTLGNVEILHGHDLSDGSLLWLAEERFVPLHSPADWEKTGIIPDVQAFADWDTFTFETDPSVGAAVLLFGHK
jgi:carboxyl-terminal processing protease